MRDHRRRDVRVKVEARDERYVAADRGADAGEDFALAVIEMLGDHRAVKIEIDGIEGARGGNVFQHHRHDALEGVFRDMGRRRRRTPDERHERMRAGGGVEETGDGHVHAGEGGDKPLAPLQRGP